MKASSLLHATDQCECCFTFIPFPAIGTPPYILLPTYPLTLPTYIFLPIYPSMKDSNLKHFTSRLWNSVEENDALILCFRRTIEERFFVLFNVEQRFLSQGRLRGRPTSLEIELHLFCSQYYQTFLRRS